LKKIYEAQDKEQAKTRS